MNMYIFEHDQNKIYRETSQQGTSQIADRLWMVEKAFSPKCDNFC